MPKKKKEPEKPIAKDDPSHIIQATMEDVMHASMIPYAEHVILDRALPRVEDGLKPVQRRILYTMMELGTTPDKPHRKCARIVGDCLGKYHPHGDSSVYDALVRMAQDFTMRGPMVDGHGNFGSIDGDSAAAMRYTEARMAPLAMEMLRDIEKDTVPFRLNFDDTLKEPDLLPAHFPNLLVNGANGIAVGLATSIPPHNLGESIDATVAMIDDPDISLDDLMKVIPGPDFPTGGILVDNEEIRRGYETGRSKLSVRAKLHIEDGSAGRKLIVITEIPYQVNKAAMLQKIQKLTEEKKAALGCVYDIRDESDRTGLRAVIELKKEADVQKTLNYLYKYSDLQVTFGVNMVAIAEGKPVQMGLKQMIGYYIDHQKHVITRRTQFELNQALARAHILQGLIIALDNLDEVIAMIRSSKTPKEAKARLMERFALSEIQAQAILDMRLQRLTNLEVAALRKEYEDLQKLIKRLEGILHSEKKLMAVIREELQKVAEEYRDGRRTEIARIDEGNQELPDDKPIPDEAVVAYTRNGYLKRMYPPVYRRSPLPSIRDDFGESARFLFQSKTDEILYVFTNLGNCYQLPVKNLTECKPKDRGQLLTGLLPGFGDQEQAIYMVCCESAKLKEQADLLFVTRNGLIKRTKAEEYDVRTKKFAAINIRKEDELRFILQLDGTDDLLMVSRNGCAGRFACESVPVQGRATTGMKGIGLDDGDEIIWCGQLARRDQMVLISERGWAKRLPALAFETRDRGSKGVRMFNLLKNAANGKYIAAVCRLGEAGGELMVRQAKTGVTMVAPETIPLQTRTEKGSPCLMALLDDVVTGADPVPAVPTEN